MFPFHVRIGPLAISPVEIFAVLGVAFFAVLGRRRMAALGVTGGAIFDLLLAALVGGAIGARLFYFVPLWLRGAERAGGLLAGWSEGSGFYGGLVGGTLAVLGLARLKRLPGRGIADAVGAYLPLGFAIGKIGCFMAGCCYGRPCAGFPGVTFPPGSLAYQTHRAAVPVHPTQLYELAFGVLLFALLLWLRRRSRHPGEIYLAYVAGYSLWRFGIEFLRDDPGRHGFGAAALSDSQIVALLFIAAAAILWAALRRSEPSAPEGAPPPK